MTKSRWSVYRTLVLCCTLLVTPRVLKPHPLCVCGLTGAFTMHFLAFIGSLCDGNHAERLHENGVWLKTERADYAFLRTMRGGFFIGPDCARMYIDSQKDRSRAGNGEVSYVI
jgi:hypothetical protein